MFNSIFKHLYENDKAFAKSFPNHNYYFYKHLAYTEWYGKVKKELNEYSLNNVFNLVKYCDINIKKLNGNHSKNNCMADVLKFGTSSLLMLINIIMVAVVGNEDKNLMNLFLTTRGSMASIIFMTMSIIILNDIFNTIYERKRVFLITYYQDLKEISQDTYETRSKIYFVNLNL